MKTYLPKITTMAALAFTAAICTAQQISVTINDQQVQFSEAQPQFINGRVLVPLRGVFEQMGASVRWNEANQSVLAQKGNKVIRLRIGSRSASVNDQRVSLDVPAMIIGGSTMVPIRFLSESLGAQVGWNESSQLVSIQFNGNNDSFQGGQNNYNDQQPPRDHERRMESGTVIPVVLNQDLAPDRLRAGTGFSVTIDSPDDSYGALPRGTILSGHVISAGRRRNSDQSSMELKFERLVTPDGRVIQIVGAPIRLDSDSAQRNDNGIWKAVGNSNQNWMPRNRLERGTRLGVLLMRDVEIPRR